MQKMASVTAGFGFLQSSALAEDPRWDFGVGWTYCDECGATPIMNRGCGACLARYCKNCAPRHHCDGLTVTIQPGDICSSLGIGIYIQSGKIVYVKPDGKGYEKGMRKSMCFQSIDGKAYTEGLLLEKISGNQQYSASLTSVTDSPNSANSPARNGAWFW